jgi:hypothetical protein
MQIPYPHICSECKSWTGQCIRGKKGKIAVSESCENFDENTSLTMEVLV